MNLQEALNLALKFNSDNESIVHIGKASKHKYELFIVTYNAEDNWFVVYYQSSSLLPYESSMEQGTFYGDNLEQLAADMSKAVDISTLTFHRYPVGLYQLYDYDMPHVFHTIFPGTIPDIESVTDSSHFQRLVDKLLATL
tara:strand:+ start:228 stop:647 length:420 start_codon:yes stop_codon:yes gene_type:complete